MKSKKPLLALTTALIAATALSSCSLFIFGKETVLSDAETFDGCKNSIFFALYNYYGLEGQHFTNKWLGMTDALENHGVHFDPATYKAEKDARKFKQSRTDAFDLPEDTAIVMVNNQTWDTGIQFNTPFAKYHPMAVISTCNGVEFASSPILSTGEGIANATMGGFSATYRQAFVNGSLWYLCAKYTAHILPIFAACVDAVDSGKPLRNPDGNALRLSIQNWAIQNLDEYDEMARIDFIDSETHTLDEVSVDSSSNLSDGIALEVSSTEEGNSAYKGYEGTKMTVKVSSGYQGDVKDLAWDVNKEGKGLVTITPDGEGNAEINLRSAGNATISVSGTYKEGNEEKTAQATLNIGIGAKSHHPLLRKINYDKYFDHSVSDSERYSSLVNAVSDSTQLTMKSIYAQNETNGEQDRAAYRTGNRLKCGILTPSSVNDQVGKYIEYMQGYLAEAYNVEVLSLGAVDSNHTQSAVAKTLINQGADFIISLQDDTERNAAAEECNRNGVYFAIGGSCQNPIDYEAIKSLPYYVGSIGTSPEEERRAAYYMTEYYLESMIQREAGKLQDWQKEYFTAKAEGNIILDAWKGVTD